MSDVDLNSIPQTAGEAEALIQGFENAPEHAEAAPAAPAAEYKINYRGKEETYPLEKLVEFAQQGRDYSQKMADFRKERTAFESESLAAKQKWAALEERLNRYAEVEEYGKKDPAWWQHVQQSYQQKLSGQGGQPPNTLPDPRLEALESTVKQFMQGQQAEKEDLALDQQITSFREKYKDVDWTTVDENGRDLEKRILDHAVKMGLTRPEHFSIAAKDLLHDELVARAAASEKEKVGKHLEKVTKAGLGPITPAPTMKMKRVENVSSKSWDEINEEAKAALGLN